MTRARQRGLVRLGAWFVLLAAVLPNVSYAGHWPIFEEAHAEAEHEHSHEDADAGSQSSEHEDHCHVGVSHCAGGVAMVGSMWVGDDERLLSMDAPDRRVEMGLDAASVEAAHSRLLQPPRFL